MNEQLGKLYAELKQYASEDAERDGAGSLFQSFRARLIELARRVTEIVAAQTMQQFREWVRDTREKFVGIAGHIPGNVNTCISDLTTQTENNLAGSERRYAKKTIQLEKNKVLWERRFGPSLAANLDEPLQKNIYWVFGIVIFLVAIESVVNTPLFKDAAQNDLGVVGGALMAITVAMVNIGVSLLLAFAGHRFFYTNNYYRIFGVGMIFLFLVWAIAFNSFIAIARESLVVSTDPDSSNLYFVLLLALGIASAVIAFWKMWSFLDPYKKARQCIQDLDATREEFEWEVCAALIAEQDRCNDISAEIRQREVEIAARFQYDEADFSHLHSTAMAETNKIFESYYQEYCPMKVDPDPDRPTVTPKNAMEFGFGIADDDWSFFKEMKKLLNERIDMATQTWLPKLHDLLEKISDLIQRFKTVIRAKLLEWEKIAQPI